MYFSYKYTNLKFFEISSKEEKRVKKMSQKEKKVHLNTNQKTD